MIPLDSIAKSEARCECGRPPWVGCPRCRPAPFMCEWLRRRAGAPRPLHPVHVEHVTRVIAENPDIFGPLLFGLLEEFTQRKD